MSPDQLRSKLEQQYSVKGIVDLSELSDSPGAVYDFFYKVHQNTFEPNDRIVIYTSHIIPAPLLEHLYNAADFVDISNCFILICSPFYISESDSDSFEFLTILLSPTGDIKNNYFLPDTVCAMPWMNLEVRENGDIYPCCVSNQSLGNVQTTTLKDQFHSDFMISLRRDLLNGQRPESCQRCWDIENQGSSSIRIHNHKRLKKPFVLHYLKNPTITSLNLRFDNTCNFKCRICNPNSSSLIAAEQQKFLGIPVQAQTKWSKSENFLKQAQELLPVLTNIDMFGGEPFLIRQFASVLQSAVDQGLAKNIRLHYNSNGSVWPEEFVSLWQYFKEVDIHFSIDAVGDRFELQRGGVWSEVEANILRIKNLNFSNLNICVMPTISILSVYYLDEVYNWANQHNFKLFSNFLLDPECFNIKNLTEQAQQLVINKFKHHPWQELQQISKVLQTISPSDGSAFREKIKWFDSVREENFSESHPEIAKAMGYVYNSNI